MFGTLIPTHHSPEKCLSKLFKTLKFCKSISCCVSVLASNNLEL